MDMRFRCLQASLGTGFRSRLLSVLSAIACFGFCSAAHAQWVPPDSNMATFKPLCGDDKKQKKVRLEEDTRFLLAPDLKAGDILYGIKFRFSRSFQNAEGEVFCKPYKHEDLGLFVSHSTRSLHTQSARRGYFQCLFDIDKDGVFDDESVLAVVAPNKTKSDGHQYRYAPTKEGADYACAVFNPNSAEDIVALKPQDIGVISDVQQIDQSTQGTSGGAALGSTVASARYFDNSSNYSATGDLKASLLGAVLGSALDSPASVKIITRYTLRTMDGEIRTADAVFNKAEFTLPRGLCVKFPSLEKLPQNLCEKPAGVKKASKEDRLTELKALFEKGLIAEATMLEQQKRILADD